MLRLLSQRFDTMVLTQFQSNPRALPLDMLEELTHQVFGWADCIPPHDLSGSNAGGGDVLCDANRPARRSCLCDGLILLGRGVVGGGSHLGE